MHENYLRLLKDFQHQFLINNLIEMMHNYYMNHQNGIETEQITSVFEMLKDKELLFISEIPR